MGTYILRYNNHLKLIPCQDYDYLFERKVATVFGPCTFISESAITIMEKYLELEQALNPYHTKSPTFKNVGLFYW